MNSLWQLFGRLTFFHFLIRWDYFVQALIVDKIFYGQKVKVSVGARRLPPDMITQVVPAAFVALFGIVSLLFLLAPSLTQTPMQRIILFVELTPFDARVPLAIIWVTWTCLCLSTSIYEVSRPLFNLRHLVVLAIGLNENVKPSRFCLDSARYFEFNKYRSFILKSDFWINLFIASLGTSGLIFSAQFEGAFYHCWWLSSLWLAAFFVFSFYLRYALYAIPGLFFIVVKYLSIKQNVLLRSFDILIINCLNVINNLQTHPKKRLKISKVTIISKFRSINRQHVKLSNEIEAYNFGFWSGQLSCFCVLFSVLLTYLTNVVFMRSLPLHAHAILDIVWLMHAICLILVIDMANRIPRGHRQYQHKLLLFFHLIRYLKVLNNRDLLKVINLNKILI